MASRKRTSSNSTRPTRPTRPLTVGDRVRAKTTGRTGEVTHVEQHGDHEQFTVSYDRQPQDEYLTTPARNGAELPAELVDRDG